MARAASGSPTRGNRTCGAPGAPPWPVLPGACWWWARDERPTASFTLGGKRLAISAWGAGRPKVSEPLAGKLDGSSICRVRLRSDRPGPTDLVAKDVRRACDPPRRQGGRARLRRPTVREADGRWASLCRRCRRGASLSRRHAPLFDTALAGIQETVLLYLTGKKGRPRAQRIITDTDATQKRLCDLFNLSAHAPAL